MFKRMYNKIEAILCNHRNSRDDGGEQRNFAIDISKLEYGLPVNYVQQKRSSEEQNKVFSAIFKYLKLD